MAQSDEETKRNTELGANLIGSALSFSARRRAAKLRRRANRERKQQAAISNSLARKVALAQQQRAVAQAEARAAAIGGAGGSQVAASNSSAQSQLSVGIAEQRRAQNSEGIVQSLTQQAAGQEAKSSEIKGATSLFTSLIG